MPRAFIEENGELGACDFCGAESVPTLAPYALHGLFHPLCVLYEQKPWGAFSLIECIESDGWKVFSGGLDHDTLNSLLDSIRHENPAEASWKSESQNWISLGAPFEEFSAEKVWSVFAEHIRHKRRFLPQAEKYEFLSDPKGWMPPLLNEATDYVGKTTRFYRARRDGKKDKHGKIIVWPKKEMTAPPKEIAPRGRANPAGISYLYAAQKMQTAVAEVRPYVGQYVSIREVRPKRRLKLANLGKVRPVATPFNDPDLSDTLRRLALLNCLNRELSKPVNPDTSEVEYVPTQYLAEVILDSGFDGIIYRSAVAPTGVNAVFFRPDDLRIAEQGQLVKVKGMSLEVVNP